MTRAAKFIRQPNGKHCLFNIKDCDIDHHNLSMEEAIIVAIDELNVGGEAEARAMINRNGEETTWAGMMHLLRQAQGNAVADALSFEMKSQEL